jgi:hypothetical protein
MLTCNNNDFLDGGHAIAPYLDLGRVNVLHGQLLNCLSYKSETLSDLAKSWHAMA